MTAQPDKAAKSSANELTWDAWLSLFLFGVLALLVSNVCVLWMARTYSDQACRIALRCAQQAAASGQSEENVKDALSTGLSYSARVKSFFVEPPHCTEFKDERAHGVRSLQIRTETLARLPAPFLLWCPDLHEGRLAVSRSYVMQIDSTAGKN